LTISVFCYLFEIECALGEPFVIGIRSNSPQLCADIQPSCEGIPFRTNRLGHGFWRSSQGWSWRFSSGWRSRKEWPWFDSLG